MLGFLLTAGATFVACATFVLAARATLPVHSGRRTADVSIFFAVTALFLFLSGLRQLAAYAGETEVDRFLFLALLAPAAATTIPLAHVTAGCLWTHRKWRRRITAFFAALVAVALAVVYTQGIEGPETSYWGTEWSLAGTASVVLLLLVITVPGLVSGGTVLRAGMQLPGTDGRRLRRIGGVLLVYYVVFTLDALALPGAFLVLERLVTAAAAVFAYRAYMETPPVNHVEMLKRRLPDSARMSGDGERSTERAPVRTPR